MDNSSLISLFFEKFEFLFQLNFTEKQIFENQTYAFGVILKNNVNGLTFSFAYYESQKNSPLGINNDVVLLKLANNGSHIDFSRLFKRDGFFIENCQYQYITLEGLDFDVFLTKATGLIKEKYIKLFTGEDWIEIKYDLRDDY